ncbi:MAG: hypothetical protein ABI591_33135 [Kofleriaceae bacterium]
MARVDLHLAVVASTTASRVHLLGTATGGVAVTADNFMPGAYALQSLNSQHEASPSPKLAAQIHSEFCGALYPYAKSGAPINGAFGSIAAFATMAVEHGRSSQVSAGVRLPAITKQSSS